MFRTFSNNSYWMTSIEVVFSFPCQCVWNECSGEPKPTTNQDKEIPGIVSTSYKWAHLKTKSRHETNRQQPPKQMRDQKGHPLDRKTGKKRTELGWWRKRELFFWCRRHVEWSLFGGIRLEGMSSPNPTLFNLSHISQQIHEQEQVDDKDTSEKKKKETKSTS